jgi:hypothetical protein
MVRGELSLDVEALGVFHHLCPLADRDVPRAMVLEHLGHAAGFDHVGEGASLDRVIIGVNASENGSVALERGIVLCEFQLNVTERCR